MEITDERFKQRAGSCWERFDWVSYISYADPAYNARREGLERELIRVGLNAQRYLNVRTPFDDVARDHLPSCRRALWDPARLNLNLGTLRMVKTAWQMGAQHALFLEDDERFLHDTQRIDTIVRALPEDYDLALLDWVLPGRYTGDDIRKLKEANGVNGYWRPFANLRCTGCFAMSANGMLQYIKKMEAAVKHGVKFKLIDQYWPDMVASGLTCYCAWPQVAIQGVPAGMTRYGYILEKYSAVGLNVNNYNLETT